MSKRDLKKITTANREAWNEAILVHRKARIKKNIDYREKFANKDYSTLDKFEEATLTKINIKGKRVAQLCCNNGRETLSLINFGANSGVGFDISDEAIKEAHELAKISNLNCEFVRTDVYDIEEKYFDSFDLVYITIGAMAWLPDLNKFFGVVSKLLKQNGHLMIYEQHPFQYMVAMDGEDEYDPDDPLKIVHSYFRTEPWVGNDGIDYIGGTKYESKTSYDFTNKISDIINGIASNGIRIQEFSEYSHDISDEFALHEKKQMIPLCFMLVGLKD